MNFVEIDPFADNRWLDFLDTTEGSSVFHHPAWLDVLRDSYGYSPNCLAATEAGELRGVLPLMEVRSWLTGKRAVCLPFSDMCGPVVRDDAARRVLLQGSEALRKEKGWKYVEMRDLTAAEGLGITARYKLHRIALGSNPAALLRALNQQSRRKLKMAEKDGVRVQRRTDPEALRAFVHLNAITRRKHGVPPQPDIFFRNLERKILGAGLGFIGVATLADRIVATSVFLHWKDTLVYKYGASDERGLAAAANYAVMWDAMTWGCESGLALFDLGRSDPTNEGLLQFKRGWGSRETDLVYVRSGARNDDRDLKAPGLLARFKPVISKLPMPLLKFVGRAVYPHFG